MGRRRCQQLLDGTDVHVATLLELQLRFVLLQFELGKPMLVHELDDFLDVFEVHGDSGSELESGRERKVPGANPLWDFSRQDGIRSG